MKKMYFGFLTIICLLFSSVSNAQINSSSQWTWMNGDNTINSFGVYGTKAVSAATNKPSGRYAGTTWTDALGNLWLFGGVGFDVNGNYGQLNDLWKYDIGTNQWTWLLGDDVNNQSGIYGTKGIAASANKPGARNASFGWVDPSGNLWLLGGNGYDESGNLGNMNDLWQYNISSGEWTWVNGDNAVNQNGVYGTQGVADVNNIPGARYGSASFTDASGNLCFFGGFGNDGSGNSGQLNDLWKYNTATGEWTWLSGDNTINHYGVYGTKGIADIANKPGSREAVNGWKDPLGNFWIFSGYGYAESGSTQVMNDLWKYNTNTGLWSWESGDNATLQFGVYGTKGVADAANKPGARYTSATWVDATGNLWLLGGYGYVTSGGAGDLNDLWKYSTVTSQWTWVNGDNTINQNGIYGTKGVIDAGNKPGGRDNSMGWKDANGNLWLFGGTAYDANGSVGQINDLWKLGITCNSSSSSNTQTTCDSLVWNGTTYTTSGTYTYLTHNASGCDSTATLNLTINNSSTSSTTTTACDSLVWNGVTYTSSGTYTYLTHNVASCDSTATLNLTVNNSSTSSTTTTACDSLVWNGTTYTASGTYTYSTTNAAGCDSTATLNLTINNSSTSLTITTACDSLIWNGITYTASGTYTFSTTNATGCDSTATLNLTINHSSTSSTTTTACDSLVWNSITYTASGTYTFSTTNATGCDSTATLNLTINNSSISSTTTTACDSLVWNGVTYTSSGTYTYSSTNAVGCDSTGTLNLTINNSSTSSTTTTACDSLVWNGVTYTASGTYTYSSTNAVGCDSTATLNLTIKNSSSSTFTTTVCDSLIWNGTIYRNTGTYTAHFTNAVGCDSTANLILTVNYKPTVAPIVGLTNIEILAIGAGGGAGGPDGTLGAGGGAGGAVYGAYTLSTTGSNIYTVGVGGAGGYGQGCAGSAPGGTAGANGGATGGAAGSGGCSGGGGGSGGWSGLYQGSNFIVVAGGGAGGGGSNEGNANEVTTPGGGNQAAAFGTSMTGQNGTAYSGDGGGGGAGGGGYYGGTGQSNFTTTITTASQAYGGANYANPTGRSSFTNYIGNSGATFSTGAGGQGTTTTISNASNFNYTNTYGKGGNAQGNGGVNTTANGNNGVVIIRYPGSAVATGGTVTQSGGYTLHTFTSAGANTFTANSGNSVCAGSTTTLNCATIGGVWTSSDTTIATINSSTGLVTGIVAGTVTITYTVTTAQGCVNSSTKSFTVNPLPIVPAITGTTTVCDNRTTALTNTLTGGIWSSSLPAKATINASTGLVTGIASGSTNITYLYTDNNGCSSSVNTTVTINASPTVAAITGNTGVCIGSTTTFSDVTLNGTWTSGNTAAATINNSGLITTVATGSSTISYTVINASACTTVVTKAITVNALPNVTANATATTVCFGTQTTLTGANASSYTWNNGVTNGVAFAPSTTNTYTVTGTDGNGCVKTANITITVNPLPIVSISPSATILCNGYSSTLTASGANTYSWNIIGTTPYLDQVSSTTTLKLAAGLHKLKSSYSGSAIRIRRSSDNAEQDFGFSGNNLDVAAISTFIGGGTAFVKTLYDQSGNGNHLSQTATGNQPTLTLSGLNGKPVIHTTTSQNIYTTTNFPTPFSIVYTARQTGGTRGRVLADWAGGNWLLGWWNGNKGAAHFNGWVGPNGGSGAADNNVYIYTGTATGSNSSNVYQNGTSITVNTAGGNGSPNGLTMNRWQNGSEPSDADFTDLVEFNSVLSASDRGTVENGMGVYYGLSGFYNTTGATAVVNPNTTTNYTVYGTDGNGCIGTATQAITVNPKPNAGADVNFICGGATQTLTGTANTGTWTELGTNPTGATLSATTSGVVTVSFTNLASGTFSFIYTLPTTNCSDTMSITVRPKPNAGADQAICILNIATGVTLTSNVTGTWSAKTGNAGTENIATPNAQATLVNNFSVVGDYNYINTNNGCTDTVMVTVTPAGSIGNYVWKDQNNDGLQNEPSANGVNGITVELYKKDGNGAFNLYTSTTTVDNAGNPGYYNFGICEDGIYKVKVPTVNPFTQTHLTTQDGTAATNGNSDVNAADGFSPEVTIDTHGSGVSKDNNTIDAGYQICTKPIAGNDFNSCGGQLVTITGVSTTPALPTTDGNWAAVASNPIGATLSVTNLGVATVQFDVTASGVYSYVYSVTGGCDDTLNITVEAKPNAGADVSSICGGQTQTVVGSPAGGAWAAQTGNPTGATVGSTSNGVANISFANLSSGLYTFIYTTVFGCTDTMTIFAYPKPNAGSDVSYICGGHSQTITATPGTGSWAAMSGNPSGATLSAISNGVATVDFTDLSAGVYSFIYTVPSGCTDTMKITAYAKPNAGSDMYEICGGSIIPLTGTPSTGTWSQAAANASGATVGATSNGVANISFANLISGTYTFIFTSVAGCTDTMTISTKPKPNAGSDVYMECGTQRLFDSLRATPIGGVWTALSSNNNLVTLGSTDGAGKARINLPLAPNQGSWSFIYTAPNGCTDTMKYVIGVVGNPAPAVNGGSNPICGTNTLQLCPTIFGWSNYQWYKNGIAISGQRGAGSCITIDTSSLGSYTVSGSNGSNCWSVQSTPIVAYASAPATPTISVTGSATVCAGNSVTLTSSATSGNQWKKDGVVISGATSQTYTASTSGVYTVIVTSSCGSTTSAGTTVTVNAAFNVAAIVASSNSVCMGTTVTLTDSTTSGVWSSSNTAIATINSSGVVTSVSAGTVTISYTVTVSGCSKTVTYNVTVPSGGIPAAPTLDVRGATAICGATVLQICPATFGWSNYQWYKNGVAIAAPNGTAACINIDTASLGSYTLAGTNGFGCWSAQSIVVNVTTGAGPSIPTISAAGSTTVCSGASVTLTSSSSINNQWKKDGVVISGATSQTYTANASGVYTVTVSNTCGSAASAGTTVTVNAAITVATIVASSNSVCMGTTITLTNATGGGVWSSSNTAVASINSLGVVTPVSAGTVTISYTVTVSGCSKTVTYSLTVPSGGTPAAPALDIRGATALCGTSTLQICPATYGYNNYQWYKNGVAIAAPTGTGACITVDTSLLGTYTLAGTNSSGCWSAQSVAVPVTLATAPTTPTISAAGSTTICNGTGVVLTSSSATGNQWKKDGVAIGGATSQTYTANASGVYTTTVTACGSVTSAGISVTVAAPITIASITASSSSVCLGNSITVSNATNGGVWSSSNTAVATINPSTGVVTTITAGSTIISYTVTVGSCSNAATYSLAVQGSSSVTTPTLDIRGSTAICGSGSLQMCPLVWGYSNYQWYKDGVPYSTASCITVYVAGAYTLTGTNGSGCWSAQSSPANVTLNTIPTVIATTGATAVCMGSTIVLSNSSSIPSGGTGVWTSFNNRATVNSATGVVTGASAGVATLIYTVSSAAGCSSSTSYNVTVNSLPSVPSIGYAAGTVNPQAGATGGAFCANRTFTLVGTPSGGVWSKTGVITVTSPAGVVNTGSVAGAASLTYTYTDANGCSNSRSLVSNIMVCASKGVNGGNNGQSTMDNGQFTMYPNPAKSSISLNVNTLIGEGQIIVTDLYGKQVKAQSLSLGTNTIDVSKLSKGFYMVSVITSAGKNTKKLVVE